MKVVLRTFVAPVKGRKKFKKVETPIESIGDIKRVVSALNELVSTVVEDLTIYDDGRNDFVKFSISIHYENPD